MHHKIVFGLCVCVHMHKHVLHGWNHVFFVAYTEVNTHSLVLNNIMHMHTHCVLFA